MSENEEKLKKNNVNKAVIILLCVALLLGLAVGIVNKKYYSEKLDRVVLTGIFASLSDYNLDVGEKELNSLSYYDESVLAYERGDFIEAESKCKISREHLSSATQSIRNINAEVLSYNDYGHRYKELIYIFYSMLEEDVSIKENLYEACEYLEAASRAYERGDYDSGDAEIERMNMKISAHDEAVRRYNDKLAEFNLELNNLIEDIE